MQVKCGAHSRGLGLVTIETSCGRSAGVIQHPLRTLLTTIELAFVPSDVLIASATESRKDLPSYPVADA